MLGTSKSRSEVVKNCNSFDTGPQAMRPTKRAAHARYGADTYASEDVSGDASDDGSDQEWDGSAEESIASEGGSIQAGRKRRTRGSAGVQQVSNLPSATTTQQQHQEGSSGAVKRYFGNMRHIIKTCASTTVRNVSLSQNITAVYPHFPVEVKLSYVMDGQAVEQQGSTMQTARVSVHDRPSVGASDRMVSLYLGKASGAHQYIGYLITGYTAESGSTTSEPKLTLHLKSPAVQEEEEKAMRAEEEETGWIVHDCHQAQRKRISGKYKQLTLTKQYLDRAFPSVEHKGMKLDITIIRDNVRLPVFERQGPLRYVYIRNYPVPRCRLSEAAASALVGCQLEQLKAKPPNLLQVIATTVDTTAAPVNTTSAATAPSPAPPQPQLPLQPPTTASRAPAAVLSVSPERASNSSMFGKQKPAVRDAHLPAGGHKQHLVDAASGRGMGRIKRQKNYLEKGDSLEAADIQLLPAATAAAATPAPTPSLEQPATDARHYTHAAGLGDVSHRSTIAPAATPTPVSAALNSATHTSPATRHSGQVTAAGAAQAAADPIAPPLESHDHSSAAAAAAAAAAATMSGPDAMKSEADKHNRQQQSAPIVAATDVICIDLESDDDRPASDHKTTVRFSQIRVKQEPCDAASQEQHAQPPSSAIAVQQPLATTAAGVDNNPATIGFKPVAQGASAPSSSDAAVAAAVNTPGMPQVEQPAATLTGDSRMVRQVAPSAAATTAQTPGWRTTTTAAAAAAATVTAAFASAKADEEQLEYLPARFTLVDCGRTLSSAGEHLTKLLDLLQAPDQQVEQLYRCINSLRSQNVDQDKVSHFWFQYSQLQLWVHRRKVSKIKYAVDQLLS